MEEPLIIKRDEIIFRIGLYICLIALLCLIVSFAVISYNQWWHGSVYDESLIAEIFLWIFSFSIGGVPLGLLLIWDSYRHDYKLDENGISDVITVSAGQNYSASYYIVKLNKKTEKGSDWKKYEKRLKEIIVDGRKQDTNYIRSIIAKAMTNANIKVKDDAFKSTFNQYLQNIGVETSDSSSSSKK
mgnify:CR=1 FL=1